MTTFTVGVALSIPGGARLDASAFPSLSLAVQRVAEEAHARWLAYAQGEPLPGGKSVNDRTGEYARSIRLRQTGDFAAEVYSDAKAAREVESGTPARDLKKMLQTSRKTRLNAKGQKYLIIPFRWSQPGGKGAHGGQMPQAVANWWKGQPASRVAGWTTRISGSGHEVPQRLYNWGASLQKPDMDRLGIRGAGARSLMKGMVQFRQPGGKGGGAKTTTLTFRTMSENSSGWIVKAKPGLRPAQTVAEQIKPVAERAFRAAFEADLARLFGKG